MRKYKTIYADPAWQIGSIELDKWQSPLSDKYPTMTDEEIGLLPIPELADDDCDLFLWVTHTKLPTGLKLIERWGFKYYCVITWDKGNGWSQHGFHKKTNFDFKEIYQLIKIDSRKWIPLDLFEWRKEQYKKYYLKSSFEFFNDYPELRRIFVLQDLSFKKWLFNYIIEQGEMDNLMKQN